MSSGPTLVASLASSLRMSDMALCDGGLELFVEFCDDRNVDCEDAAYYSDECFEHGVMVVDLFVELTCGLLYYYIGRISQILLEFFILSDFCWAEV